MVAADICSSQPYKYSTWIPTVGNLGRRMDGTYFDGPQDQEMRRSCLVKREQCETMKSMPCNISIGVQNLGSE